MIAFILFAAAIVAIPAVVINEDKLMTGEARELGAVVDIYIYIVDARKGKKKRN